MRAAWYEKQGPAREVLKIGEMADPTPGPGEVRIRMVASGINPGDVKKRQNGGAGLMGSAPLWVGSRCRAPPESIWNYLASPTRARVGAWNVSAGRPSR
jgi:hypothetical protein